MAIIIVSRHVQHVIHTCIDAQTAQEVAQVIMNLVLMKQASMRVTDVPFNIGTNYGR